MATKVKLEKILEKYPFSPLSLNLKMFIVLFVVEKPQYVIYVIVPAVHHSGSPKLNLDLYSSPDGSRVWIMLNEINQNNKVKCLKFSFKCGI